MRIKSCIYLTLETEQQSCKMAFLFPFNDLVEMDLLRCVEPTKIHGVVRSRCCPTLDPMAIIKQRRVALAPLLSVSIPLSLSLAWQPLVHNVKFPQIYASLAFSVIAFIVTLALIPRFGSAFVKIGLRGRDLLKKSTDDVSVQYIRVHTYSHIDIEIYL